MGTSMSLASRWVVLTLIAVSFYWPQSAAAQTFVCPSGPGPGEVQVGTTGGSGGVAVIPICASDGSADSSDEGGPADDDPVWESRWGAIARGKAGGWGAVTDMVNEKSAAKAALKQCKATADTKSADCKISLTYYDQCVAYVWGSAGGVASAAVDLPTASEQGLKKCRETSSDCEILYSACSLPQRVN